MPRHLSVASFRDHLRSGFPSLTTGPLVVAVSGGADSVALLHLLHRARPDLRLVVAHVHHGLRGRDADLDAAFVRDLAGRLALPAHQIRLDPPQRTPRGREATWRDLRYAALDEVRADCGAAVVATGHHADDVAEGVVMQLLRGSGPRALAGIHAHSGRVMRPLLAYRHEQLVAFLTAHGLDWREDASNADRSLLRNRVRHEVLPRLEEVSPALRTHLLHLAGALALDEEALRAWAASVADLAWWRPDRGVGVDEVEALPVAVRIRWLQRQAAAAGLARATRRQVDHFAEVVTGARTSVTLSERWRIRRFRHRLWLEPPHEPEPWVSPVGAGGAVRLPLPGWSAVVRTARADDERSLWAAPLPCRAVELRSVNSLADDRQRSRATSALSRRVPRHLRAIWPVLCSDAKILWIPGVPGFDGPRASDMVVEVAFT